MRYLFLSILVLFATQPLQASFCDMGADQSSSHQAMSDSDMHASMNHGNDSDTDRSSEHDSDTMDCCDDKSASGAHGCTAIAHCGACPASLVAVNPTISSSWLGTSNGNMPSLSQVPPNNSGLWLLYLLGYNFSVAVGVGFIALAGVAVEIGVVMLVYLKQALKNQQIEAANAGRAMQREDLEQAVFAGALMRVRPIMMTVAAIIAGLLPIMLGDGTGSEVMRRIAAPMVGGMVSATILTLAVIPAIFLVWQEWKLKSVQRHGR